jgi:hypothetical protein
MTVKPISPALSYGSEAFRDDFATTPIGEPGVHLKYLFLLMNICSFDIPSKPPSHSVAGSIA